MQFLPIVSNDGTVTQVAPLRDNLSHHWHTNAILERLFVFGMVCARLLVTKYGGSMKAKIQVEYKKKSSNAFFDTGH